VAGGTSKKLPPEARLRDARENHLLAGAVQADADWMEAEPVQQRKTKISAGSESLLALLTVGL